MTTSINTKTSRYVSGGVSEVYKDRIEWWERQNFVLSDTDSVYIVNNKTINRLDLIAYSELGDSKLWWLVAMYNRILDPFEEVIEGRVLRIPSALLVQSILSNKLGGIPSTRQKSPNTIKTRI